MNLIFDVDGTLWDTTGVVARGWQKAVDITGLSRAVMDKDVLKGEFGKTMDVIARNVFPDVKDKKDIDILTEHCNIYEEKELDSMDEEETRSIVYEGVIDTLEALSKSHSLFIVSNCQQGYIEMFMKKTGTGSFIKDHLCYGDTGTQKAETILTLMDRNGISKEDTFYIGDTAGDFDSTRKAGLRFVYASYGFGEVAEPDLRISSFKELTELFPA